MYLNIRRLEDYQKIRSEKYLGINISKDYQGIKMSKDYRVIKISDSYHRG